MDLLIKCEKTVLISSPINDDETQNLKFLSDADGVFICSFHVEKHGDEPNCFNIQLTFQQFEDLLSQLAKLIPINYENNHINQ